MMRLAGLALLWLALAAGVTPAASAHEIRPAFLQIREIEHEVYDFLWKTPARGEMRLALNVLQPSACANLAAPRSVLAPGAVIERWRARCEGGLPAKPISIENLAQTLTDVIVRFEPLDRSPQTLRVKPDDPVLVIPERQEWTDVAWTYFVIGMEHILLGIDHLLFVLALMLLVPGRSRLLGAITAFTIAHSITLAGTTFGWVRLPSSPVEAVIALSIMFVAVEIMRVRAGRYSLTAAMPWLASFSFGLLHGFGFAGALREVGIPQDAAPQALLFFNLGVEAGQLVFIAGVLLVMGLWRRLSAGLQLSSPAQDLLWRAPVYVIGVTAGFWFVERTLAVLGV
jgi:hydrogenase/urease accessory protein HupE